MQRIKKLIDQGAINLAAKSLPPGFPRPDAIRAAAELLAQPNLLRPADQTAKINFGPKATFRFPSSIKTPHPRNDTVHGRLFRAGASWATRPTVILVHGWNAELHYLYILPWLARALNRRNLNAALVELPFHMHRRPLERNGMRDFISDDLPGMLLATRQSISDIHSLSLWAKAQGSPTIAVWGFSLGAWLAGLYICESDLPTAAVLTTPVSDLARGIAELAFCHPIRSSMSGAKLDFSALNLTTHQPKIPRDAIQVVQSSYDLFVPPDTYADLAAAWNLDRWEKQPQGHISILTSRSAMRQSIDWLAKHL